MDHSLTTQPDAPTPDAPTPDAAAAGRALALLQDPALAPLFLRPTRTGVESTWYGHIPFAHWLVAATRPRVLVELGAHNGVSYAAFCAAAAQAGAGTRCYAVDTWQGDGHAGEYGDQVYDDLRRFHDPLYGAFSTLMRCTFAEALPHFADGSVDLLHIDGFHTYAAVAEDYRTWRPKLSPRAVVLFHDTNERRADFGVWRLWAELSAEHPGFEFLHSHGLGVLAVGADAPAAVRALCAAGPEAAALLRERFGTLGERWMDHFEASHAVTAQRAAEASNAGLRGEVAALHEFRGRAEAAEADAEALGHDLDALQREHADTLDELARAWTFQSALEAKLDARDGQADHLQSLLAQRAADWERVHVVLAARDADAAALRAELAQARAERDALHASLSWRITRPVRQVAGLPPLRRARRLAGLALRGKLGEHRAFLAQRSAEVEALRATPLFDAAWYLQQHPALAAAGHDPAAHFAWTGAAAGAQPNPWFDTGWYIARNPEVAASGENPLLHWLRVGAAAGLDPNAFLDVDWYSARHGVAASGMDPLTHYIRHGIPARHDPNPGLDAAAYASEAPGLDDPDVRDDPLLHWWRIGAGTARDPAPLFDAAWYRARHKLGHADPLAHWLDGDRTGPTSPLHLLPGMMTPQGPRPIRFAPCDAPDVSIIVPAYGHLGDTLRCLYSVMACSGDADARDERGRGSQGWGWQGRGALRGHRRRRQPRRPDRAAAGGPHRRRAPAPQPGEPGLPAVLQRRRRAGTRAAPAVPEQRHHGAAGLAGAAGAPGGRRRHHRHGGRQAAEHRWHLAGGRGRHPVQWLGPALRRWGRPGTAAVQPRAGGGRGRRRLHPGAAPGLGPRGRLR